jgi:putative ABC transport system permease protein
LYPLMQSRASFVEAFSVALQSLRASKLRTFLTLLGVILATTTLIAVMSVIEGMNRYIAEHIASDLGTDSFQIRKIVMIGRWDPKTYLEMQRRNPELNRAEYEFLKSHATLSPEIGLEAFRNCTVHLGQKTLERIELEGGSANIGLIANMPAANGHFPLDAENERHAMVAFLGGDINNKLFPNVDAVGKSIDIDGRKFEVVGVAKAKGTIFGESMDNYVVIPIETYVKIYGARSGLGYHALAARHEELNQAEDEVRMLLRAFRHVPPKEKDNFGIFTSESVIELWSKMTAAIAATAIAIVSVFMVVGGIVIMNIMLAVVTERTHEIGVRKAVGARRSDILRQFLVESSMMASVGGLAGVLIAWGVAMLVRNTTPVPMAVPAYATIIGVGVSAIVGLFFGIYPAQRASKLDPIAALRAEV